MQENKLSVLVVVWSSWCQACAQMLASTLKTLTHSFFLKLKLLNFDKNLRELVKLGIKHLPVTLLFRNNKPIGARIGVLTAQVLSDWLISKI